jgi:hypothetical protein
MHILLNRCCFVRPAVAGGGLEYSLPLSANAVSYEFVQIQIRFLDHFLFNERINNNNNNDDDDDDDDDDANRYLSYGDDNAVEWRVDGCVDGGRFVQLDSSYIELQTATLVLWHAPIRSFRFFYVVTRERFSGI